nr:hypothetical protein Iba_chr03aCG7110 [Ipomoea batatas]GMD05875.1 hypothetical protein Iba_chr06bCG10650 [Ipomoea batatas]
MRREQRRRASTPSAAAANLRQQRASVKPGVSFDEELPSAANDGLFFDSAASRFTFLMFTDNFL